ncbi:MAG TPA: class I SAM-dependent methyltransferase [Methylomirabilota bacterium]
MSPAFWELLTSEPLPELGVLDVGTGTGRVALAVGPLSRRVVGVDRDPVAIGEAARRAAAAGLCDVEFVVADAETIEYSAFGPELVTAHLCMSDAIVERAGRALAPGRVLAFVAFHRDQWRETGRPSRFAYDEERARQVLAAGGFHVEHLEVEREVRRFGSVEEALAAAIGLQERWQADGRWFHYVRFLEEGGRTLTRSHLIVKARKA